ncbi:unnamed protein product [Symbiodinium necroappetens]|uniref:Uncharacterized protein n=1 Tax=Symbiodinium necroappetens TaxID=1628268 RepID=A0A813BY88_9DINO|nr:unnamed protein product [Symbiodinium necroappetens]
MALVPTESSFLSSLNVDRKRALDRQKKREELLVDTEGGTKILGLHQDLQALVDVLDERVESKLSANEKAYFVAYKSFMFTVQKEYKELKQKADEEETKTRRDAKIQSLEKELDWFMNEALRLDELVKKYKKELDKWKGKAEALEDDRQFLENQIKQAKRTNKSLRSAVEEGDEIFANISEAPGPDGKESPTKSDDGCRKAVSPEACRDVDAHAAQFAAYTGMTPKWCYRLVLISLVLRVMGGCWVAFVALEYTRYYVLNDLTELDLLRVLTGSPQFAVQAFLFPFLGVLSDRVSRKKLILASSVAISASAWLMTVVPSVEVYIFTKVLALVSDVGGPIRDAMLRDIFSADEWELKHGGVTGLKARLAIVGQMGFALAMAVGMAIIKLGEVGIGLPNEYTVHKEHCGAHHCIQPGHFSWDGPWAIDGSLRLMMLMGSVALSLETVLVAVAFPETIKPELRTSTRKLVVENWRVIQPWNNLRVFATHELRLLMSIRTLGYVIAAGGGSVYMSFYQRFEFDTFTMMTHTVLAGAATWLTTLAVPKLVDRLGDMRGVWIPSIVLSMLYGVACGFIPAGHGYLVYVVWPLLGGPSFALTGFAPDLLAKLVPADVQGTFTTAKSFLFRLSQAIFMWPWNQLFMHTAHFAYPLDATALWVSLALGVFMLMLTCYACQHDPREAIKSGRALDAFMASDYAKSSWYKKNAAEEVFEQQASAAGGQQMEMLQYTATLSRQVSKQSKRSACATRNPTDVEHSHVPEELTHVHVLKRSCEQCHQERAQSSAYAALVSAEDGQQQQTAKPQDLPQDAETIQGPTFNGLSQELEEKYQTTVRRLKQQLQQEQKQAAKMRAIADRQFTEPSELEAFFLECVDQVKTEITERRKAALEQNKALRAGGEGKARGYPEALPPHLAKLAQTPTLDDFTVTDRRKVVELLLSSEHVLQFLYDKLFPPESSAQ